MADVISKEYLRLDFITDALKTGSVNVNYPKEDLTADEVKTAMEKLASSNVLLSSAGTFNTPKSATRIKTDKTSIKIE